MPVVLHMVPEFEPAMNVGIVALFSRLPDSFYGHISPEFLPAYEQAFTLEPHGEYLKMALASSLPELKTDISIPLSPIHHAEVKAFADAHYPGNWFEPEMLDTGEYRGIRENGELIALAGVHAVSERYRGAALGNIITHTEQRSRGLGKAITLSVIHHLQEKGIETLGLNVRSDNPAAIRCYEALGFRTVGRYTEVMLRRR
jgi:ribosomal protein S18 acetylase RimI-like enzyme